MMENLFTIENGIAETREVSGYIACFDTTYFSGIKRTKEQYENTLKMLDDYKCRIPLLDAHTSRGGKYCGIMTSYTIDENGIKATFKLDNSAYVNENVIPSIENGTLTHFSTEETSASTKGDLLITGVALVPIGNGIHARIENELKVDEVEDKPKRNIIHYL